MAEEKQIEQKLVRAINSKGGLCWKFNSGIVGVPDRICLLKKGICAFVEVKAPGKHLRPIQEKRKRQLEELGFKVYVLDSEEGVKVIVDEFYTT